MSSGTGGLEDRLREAREAAGLTQQQVADWLGIRRPSVVEIESGRRAVKSDELAKLAVLYGRSLRWFASGELGAQERIQAALFRANKPDDSTLRREAGVLAKRCQWLGEVERKLGLSRTKRHTPQYADEYALRDRGSALEHGRAVAYQERQRLGLGLTAPLRDPWGIVEDAGLHVFSMRLGSHHGAIDGIFARLDSGHACVGVNTDKWVFRQIFTVVHEYGHALLDADLASEVCATAHAWTIGGERREYANRELRANQFAAVFLAPREAILFYLEGRGKLRSARGWVEVMGLTPVDVVRAQDHFGVSCDMLLWRLQNENLIDAAERRALKDELESHGVGRIAAALGYDWQAKAQPFPRSHEIALRAYQKGWLSLGVLSEVFGHDKAEMMQLLREWSITQEFADDDALVGAPA